LYLKEYINDARSHERQKKIITGLLPKKLPAKSTLPCSQHSTMDRCLKRITCNSNPQTLDSGNMRRRVQSMSLSYPKVLFSTLCSTASKLYSSPSVRDNVLYPCEAAATVADFGLFRKTKRISRPLQDKNRKPYRNSLFHRAFQFTMCDCDFECFNV
jgi:hypothetical protein